MEILTCMLDGKKLSEFRVGVENGEFSYAFKKTHFLEASILGEATGYSLNCARVPDTVSSSSCQL